MKKYNGLFIFPETLAGDSLKEAIDRVQKEAESNGAVIESIRELGKRAFARPMKKKDAGHYARMVFEMDPAKVNALRDRYVLMEEVFRAEIVVAKEIVTRIEE